MFFSDTSPSRKSVMNKVRSPSAQPFRRGAEGETPADERLVVHAADFAAGGVVEAAGHPTKSRQGWVGGVESYRGDNPGSARGCIPSECRLRFQTTAANCTECSVSGIMMDPVMLNGPGYCGSLRAVSSGGAELPTHHDDKTSQRFVGGFVHRTERAEHRRVGIQGELSTSGLNMEERGKLGRDVEAGSSAWQARAPATRDSGGQHTVGSSDEGESFHTDIPPEQNKLYLERIMHITDEGPFTAGVLPSREDLVRRLLPVLPPNCAILFMKNSIESLYDDSVAAVSSAQAALSSSKGGGSGCTKGGDNYAGSASTGKPLELSGGSVVASPSNRVSARAAVNRDNEREARLLQPGVECGQKMVGDRCDADLFARGAFKHIWGLRQCDFEEARKKALEGVNGKSVEVEGVSNELSQLRAVVYVVREEWEAFTLNSCSHTGVVRAVASEVSHVSVRNRPPVVCKGLPTMAVGGVGCQHCRKQQSRACSGWWRSRYVLMRVIVTLADRSSDGSKLKSVPASKCSRHVEGGSGDVSSCPDCKLEQRKKSEELHGSTKSSFVYQAWPPTPEGSGLGTHPEKTPLCTGVEAVGTEPSPPRQTSPLQSSLSDSSVPFQQQGGLRTGCCSGDQAAGGCSCVGAPTPIYIFKHGSVPSGCMDDGVQLELKEFAAEPFWHGYRESNHELHSGGNQKIAEALDMGCSQAQVTLDAIIKGEWYFSKASEESLLRIIENTNKKIEAPMEPNVAGDLRVENRNDSREANERLTRLASLLSSPCDSFEGFVSSGCGDAQRAAQELSSNNSTSDSRPLLPHLWGACGGEKAVDVPSSDVPLRGPSHQQVQGNVGATLRDGVWQYSGAHRGKRRVLRRSFKSQTASCFDSAGGARRVLAHCYAVCASTIRMEVVAEAQNSYLGLCMEERELAAVFLEFVALVAPGAINTGDDAGGIGVEQPTFDVSDPVDDIERKVRASYKRKQVHMRQSRVSVA